MGPLMVSRRNPVTAQFMQRSITFTNDNQNLNVMLCHKHTICFMSYKPIHNWDSFQNKYLILLVKEFPWPNSHWDGKNDIISNFPQFQTSP